MKVVMLLRAKTLQCLHTLPTALVLHFHPDPTGHLVARSFCSAFCWSIVAQRTRPASAKIIVSAKIANRLILFDDEYSIIEGTHRTSPLQQSIIT